MTGNGLLRLRDREMQILLLMANEGLDVPGIAERLHISTHTVKTHLDRTLRAMGVHRQQEAIALAWRWLPAKMSLEGGEWSRTLLWPDGTEHEAFVGDMRKKRSKKLGDVVGEPARD